NKQPHLTKTTTLSPTRRSSDRHAGAYNNRGWSYYLKHQYDQALLEYHEAIRISPTTALYFKNRGWVYNNKQQWNRTIADYSRALDRKSTRLNSSQDSTSYAIIS